MFLHITLKLFYINDVNKRNFVFCVFKIFFVVDNINESSSKKLIEIHDFFKHKLTANFVKNKFKNDKFRKLNFFVFVATKNAIFKRLIHVNEQKKMLLI